MAVGVSLQCPDLDPEQIFSLSQDLVTSLSEAGISAQRAEVVSANKAGREYRGDPISLGSLFISIADKASVSAVISSLKALFARAPKSLSATVTNSGKTFSFTAANLGSEELDKLIALLQQQA